MYDKNNIFAKIIRGEIASKKVYEDDDIIAIHDIHPIAPVHVLVLPKGEYISLHDFAKKAGQEKIAKFFLKLTEIADMLNISEKGYKVIANHGQDGGQTVPHFHMHLIGGKKLPEGF